MLLDWVHVWMHNKQRDLIAVKKKKMISRVKLK